MKWAYRLRDTIPSVRWVVKIGGAKLFWPEERPDELIPLRDDHWSAR